MPQLDMLAFNMQFFWVLISFLVIYIFNTSVSLPKTINVLNVKYIILYLTKTSVIKFIKKFSISNNFKLLTNIKTP